MRPRRVPPRPDPGTSFDKVHYEVHFAMSQTTTQPARIEEFKRAVEEDWASQATASAWQKYKRQMHFQTAAVTAVMADAAQPKPGMRILDLASGTGHPALDFAHMVEPSGSVVATDLNRHMLTFLSSNAARGGLRNVETRPCEPEELPFESDTFDRATSRFGVMFFADVPRALAEVHRVLKPGGKAVFVAWGPPVPGSYFATTGLPFLKRAPEPLDPDGPQPMRFAERGKLASLFESAEFQGVEESRPIVPFPFKGTPRQLLEHIQEIAKPFRKLVNEVPDSAGAEKESITQLERLSQDGILHLTAPLVVVSGSKG